MLQWIRQQFCTLCVVHEYLILVTVIFCCFHCMWRFKVTASSHQFNANGMENIIFICRYAASPLFFGSKLALSMHSTEWTFVEKFPEKKLFFFEGERKSNKKKVPPWPIGTKTIAEKHPRLTHKHSPWLLFAVMDYCFSLKFWLPHNEIVERIERKVPDISVTPKMQNWCE